MPHLSLPLLTNAQEYNNCFANVVTLPHPNLLSTLLHVPTPPSSRAGRHPPPPPDKSQQSGVTDTSRTLLYTRTVVDNDSNVDKMYNEDDGYTPVRAGQGVRTTPLQVVIPTEVITPPVDTRNAFNRLGDDLSSTKSNPPDMITTPSLQQVLNNIPPPDVNDGIFAERIVDSFHQTARMVDDTLKVARPRTLADAFAQLKQMESFVMESTATVTDSVTKLGSFLRDLHAYNKMMKETTIRVIMTCLGDQEKVSGKLTSHMKKHVDQLSNLMELEKACHKQMDNHWKRLEDIESLMKRTDKNIATTNEAIAATIHQNDRLTAQITGVCANAETAATNARSDITDLRARLLLDLRNALSTLFTEMKTLQDTLLILGMTLDNHLKSVPLPPETATMPIIEKDSTNATTSTNPPLRTMPLFDPTHCFDSSWYHSATNQQQDDPAGYDDPGS
jgi:hypothetical protein